MTQRTICTATRWILANGGRVIIRWPFPCHSNSTEIEDLVALANRIRDAIGPMLDADATAASFAPATPPADAGTKGAT